MNGKLAIKGDAPEQCRASFRRGYELVAGPDAVTSVLLIEDQNLPADGFRIEHANGDVVVRAGSAPGFQYAGSQLQLDRTSVGRPQSGPVHKPAFAKRGVMLDISRNKVPTMATLRELVHQLAARKINHLQLYTEHTFAYRDHEKIWRDASPMTAEEIRTLDAWCRDVHIELAANQNSLGHLHRWLRHPDYIHLAEAPEGYTTPWGEKRTGPFSLNPALPDSLNLLDGWYAELLPNFSSPWINVGCDEAFDLGQGASRSACEERGKGRVYLDYLMQVKRLVEQYGRRMMFWGDIILHHPDMIPHLEKDALALVWGYEADHPFDRECRAFADAGIPFWVCPGTSTWNSITGRLDNALANMQRAAEAGHQHGASGYMITEWGDNGHWQTMPFSMMALTAGAETAWSGHAPGADELASMIPAGPAIRDLGRIYLDAGFPLHNTSPVFPFIRFSEPEKMLSLWTTGRLQQALDHLAALERNSNAITSCNDAAGQLWGDEIRLGARMLHHALARGAWLKNGKKRHEAEALTVDMSGILDELPRLWLARNRPGGLDESVAPLKSRLNEYRDRTPIGS